MQRFAIGTASAWSDTAIPGVDVEPTTSEFETNHHATPEDRIQSTIKHIAHLLPAQGPITVFIHHNTLHAFEHLSFEDAVRQGAEVFGCQPFLTEERYRREMNQGRIRHDDLVDVLRSDLGPRTDDSILGLATRLALRMAMLERPIWSGSESELNYYLADTEAYRRIRSDLAPTLRSQMIAETRRWAMRDLRLGSLKARPAWASKLLEAFNEQRIEDWPESIWEHFTVQCLWSICREAIRHVPVPKAVRSEPIRHRDYLEAVTGHDTDLVVNDILVRFSASFLDQGVSHWTLPNRDEGFFRSFLRLYASRRNLSMEWASRLSDEAHRFLTSGIRPVESILESLEILGVTEAEWEPFLAATLLALRGWAGMIHQVEIRGDRVALPVAKGSLEEFLAVRLLLDRLALEESARRELGFDRPLAEFRAAIRPRIPKPLTPTTEQRALTIVQLGQSLGWTPEMLSRLTPIEWGYLINEIEEFDEFERRRVFQLAYERRFRTMTLDAMALHQRSKNAAMARPRFQVITCLDEREESFRRHLEEVAPDAETFGAAGFFNVVMYYRGASDAHFVPLCPIVLTPSHWVEEHVRNGHVVHHERRRRTRKILGTASHRLHAGTRSFAAGAILSAGLGVLASVPLVARVLFPRLAARIRNRFTTWIRTPAATELKLERVASQPGIEHDALGFSVDEMTTASERLLRDIGLTKTFSRFVFILGHGSDSVNNPHKSAYDCGACGGSPGAPNGRALAQMLNDPRIRERIAANGIEIPNDTWFVGGYHNTCDDTVTLADLDRIPTTHRAELARIQQEFARTSDRNAHERCRRFMSAKLDLSPSDARKHVENRSEDLAQVRPELGHATNAICIVGRRERSRGLFLDRRAFLASYDPLQDDAIGSTLARLLGAAVPVCGGINLEYYFSHVDPHGYGCGTKLPHNIASLIGVMDGAASDLRTGLPWQMVEIHEPIRLLMIVETTPETLLAVMSRNPLVDTMIRNGWVQMAVLDPHQNTIRLFKSGEFIPYEPSTKILPRARTSFDWYRGWRGHLEFAELVGSDGRDS